MRHTSARGRLGARLVAMALAICCTALSRAGAPEKVEPARPLPPAQVAAPPAVPTTAETFAGLAFMAGCWEGEQDGVRSEECWLTPANGLMVGMHRDLFKGDRAFFEFLRIESQAEGIAYLASPAGAPATAFRLVAAATGRVEFANPQHDYPQRIIYQADGSDRLKARVEGPGTGGATRFEEWTWTRRR